MPSIPDYHIHTPLCGHAVGEPSEYVLQAIKLGLQEIGFADHAPLLLFENPSLTMNTKQLPQYHKMIEDLQRQHVSLPIKIALEADFIPGFEEKTKTIIEDYPYDYVIGSVHFIKEWGFDNPDERDHWDEENVNSVYQDYYELLRQSAKSGIFDIMAHVDLVKKFGHLPTEDLTDEIRATAKILKDSGVAIEINTSGLRKPVQEIYPALSTLKIYNEANVPLVFGSDAHDPKDVGKGFDKAMDLVKAAGYTQHVIFKNRKIVKTVEL